MKCMSIDIETFSSESLQKGGVYRYVESQDFEILLFGYSVDGSPVRVIDLASGESIPGEILDALSDASVVKWAFNAHFERICLSRFLGFPTGEYLDPSQWRCSMIWSAYMGLPLSLEGSGAVLGLEKQKLTEGKDLIRYFCLPCSPTKTNGGRTRNLPSHAPDKWERFKAYNLRDVETEMQIQEKLAKFPVPDEIWDEYHLDQEINDRGIRVDMPFVRSAISLDGIVRERLSRTMRDITDLENPNSVAQMKSWLSDNGIETESLGKKDVKAMLKDADGDVGEALSLRLQLSKTSVKKYQAMENAVCSDGRLRGCFQFYGANRTGRFAGRLVQLQNLPQNHMSDLAEARALVRSGDVDALDILYDDIPDVLSQLIRTAFVPAEGKRFFVADFSAIEARVIAWFAGETWKSDAFKNGEDIYCSTASRMFGKPVVKHGINGELRQKGKIAELACIAKGSPVLTDRGLKPIQEVAADDLVWDGAGWVRHDGVVYRGRREVIEYEGLRATADHPVWVEGKQEPVHLGVAAACGAHLVRTGDGGNAIRLGGDHECREEVERKPEPLPCPDTMPGMRIDAMAGPWQPEKRKIQGLPGLFATETDSEMAGQEADRGETEVREPEGQGVSGIWRTRNKVPVPERARCRTVPVGEVRDSGQDTGTGQDRHQWGLRSWEPEVRLTYGEPGEQEAHGPLGMVPNVLAVQQDCGDEKTGGREDEGGCSGGCQDSGIGTEEELEADRGPVGVYDIRNAGPHHRYTVSGRLVHNCGYGGSVGALTSMGALEYGLTEDELQPLVDAWRQANPNIVRFWWSVDSAVKKAINGKTTTELNGVRFSCRSGMLFITLPSGRVLSYVKPRLEENRFGGQSVTYEGVGTTKKWERVESYGPKFVENIIQAISRDILMYAMKRLRNMRIVAHVHDELIIEADPDVSLERICSVMGSVPPWAEGLILRADGYVCDFYQKD